MKAQDFIRTKIKELVVKVPSVKVSYEFVNDIDTHILEVVPLMQFEENANYIELENELYDAFAELYFPSTLLIVSEDSINKVEKPVWTIEGEDFGVVTLWAETLCIEGFSIDSDSYESIQVGVDFSCCDNTPYCIDNCTNNYALAA